MTTNDTSATATRHLVDAYRQMPAWRKLQQVTQLTQAVQQMALTRMRSSYGQRPEREERLRLASLWLPRHTMISSFGWDPRREGQ